MSNEKGCNCFLFYLALYPIFKVYYPSLVKFMEVFQNKNMQMEYMHVYFLYL